MAGTIRWYKDPSGNVPVLDFLQSTDKKHRAKILSWITFLQVSGVTLGDPYTSQIQGRLRELKADFGRNPYRILYYWDSNRDPVLLHAFLKQSQRLPERDRTLGLERMWQDMKTKAKGWST